MIGTPAKDVASSVVVPNRIAPRLSTLTVRADDAPLPMVVYRIPPRWQFAHTRSQAFTAYPYGDTRAHFSPWLPSTRDAHADR